MRAGKDINIRLHWTDGDGGEDDCCPGFIVTCPEAPGYSGFGDTVRRALNKAADYLPPHLITSEGDREDRDDS